MGAMGGLSIKSGLEQRPIAGNVGWATMGAVIRWGALWHALKEKCHRGLVMSGTRGTVQPRRIAEQSRRVDAAVVTSRVSLYCSSCMLWYETLMDSSNIAI